MKKVICVETGRKYRICPWHRKKEITSPKKSRNTGRISGSIKRIQLETIMEKSIGKSVQCLVILHVMELGEEVEITVKRP